MGLVYKDCGVVFEFEKLCPFPQKLLNQTVRFAEMSKDTTIPVYHYTTETALRTMKTGMPRTWYYDPHDGRFIRTYRKGLLPREQHFIHPSITGLPNEAYLPASYAFLEPNPSNWHDNKRYPFAWDYIEDYLTDIAENNLVLLEIALISEDRAYVADAGYLMPLFIRECDDAEKHQLFTRRWESRVPIALYNLHRSVFELPEVVIQSIIPPDRIRKVWNGSKSAIESLKLKKNA